MVTNAEKMARHKSEFAFFNDICISSRVPLLRCHEENKSEKEDICNF